MFLSVVSSWQFLTHNRPYYSATILKLKMQRFQERKMCWPIYINIKVRVQKTQHEFLVNPLWRRMLLNQFQYCEFYPYENIFFCRALLIPAAIEVSILACQCLIRLLLKYMHIFMIHLTCYQVTNVSSRTFALVLVNRHKQVNLSRAQFFWMLLYVIPEC